VDAAPKASERDAPLFAPRPGLGSGAFFSVTLAFLIPSKSLSKKPQSSLKKESAMNVWRTLCVIPLILGSGLTASALIIYVPGGQPTIQAGINAAVNGDTVMVAPGIYQENIHFRKKGIVVASRFILNDDPVYINSTVIDGSNPASPDSASCVRIVSDSILTTNDTTAALIGFTLTGGTGTRWFDEHGAGTYREGGGIVIQYLSPRILFNRITGNHAVDGSLQSGGGGIGVGDGNPRILNNVIMGNTSATYGGGIVLNYTGVIIKNNLVAYDTTGTGYGGGGGIWSYSNDGSGRPRIIENNAIFGNSTGTGTGLAGGVSLGSSTALLRNNILWGNRYSQIRGAGATVTYCDVQGGYSGNGNTNRYPAFLDTVRFYLSDTSACIDAGDTTAIYNDPEDPRNPGYALWPSRGLLRNDMGAYGGPGRTTLLAGVEEAGNAEFGMRNAELRITPNPFTTFATLPGHPGKRFSLYDISGRRVGTYRGDRIGEELSSGVYFLRAEGKDSKPLRIVKVR
jgi:hypothetical protein